MVTDTYCPLLFTQLVIKPDKTVGPCCRFTNIPGHSSTDITAAFNSEYMNNLRSMVLQNQKAPPCVRCYAEDAAGKLSFRRSEFFNFPHMPTQARLESLELSLDNLCNLKCRSCGPHLSTKWRTDAEKLNIISDEFNTYIDSEFDPGKFDLKSLKRLGFLGGEPFLNCQRLIDVIKRCDLTSIDNPLQVYISTNGTVLPSAELVSLLAQCNTVIRISYDGVGKLANYFRSGCDYNSWLANAVELYKMHKPWIKTDKTQQGIYVNLHSTVCVYNLNCLPTHDKLVQQSLPNILITRTILHGPSWLNIRNFPTYIKNKISVKFDSLDQSESHFSEYQQIKNYMMQSQLQPFEKFIEQSQKLDYLRRESLADANPELDQWINDLKNSIPN